MNDFSSSVLLNLQFLERAINSKSFEHQEEVFFWVAKRNESSANKVFANIVSGVDWNELESHFLIEKQL